MPLYVAVMPWELELKVEGSALFMNALAQAFGMA
jgi:hypothetical protein